MAAKHRESSGDARADALLEFWFDADPADGAQIGERMRRWFGSTADGDRELALRFGPLAADALAGRLDALADGPRGRLALILLLDQLPRNLHRGTAAAFAGDARALALCLEGQAAGQASELEPAERIFFFMPLQHAEDIAVQRRSVVVFADLAALPAPPPLAAALGDCADYAVAHHEIVARFGRFPHRNRALGRDTTAEEAAFLASGGSSFGQ